GAMRSFIAIPGEADSLLASLEGPVIERLDTIEKSTLFKLPKMDRAHVFYDYACIYDSDIDGFIRFCRLSNDQGALSGEKVRIITAHAAKGLEFKCVFIAGLSQGVFPMADSDEKDEQNLFYVAMTRAMDLLYLVSSDDACSPFLNRIPKEYCTMLEEKRRSPVRQLKLFEC
ncbi:MAG TPA: 3'-5' exonuclease, partial [Deltaproteobacteria bacterium]|nr:3'-5' exonuclease [Deltaproteobacteria bacterium]